MPYFFNLGHFDKILAIFLFLAPKPENGKKMVKMAPNEKNKTTFISPTLKVGEIKVGLFFLFEPFFYQF